MTLADWLSTTIRSVRSSGADGIRESLRQLWVGLLRRMGKFVDPGTNVFEKDWDVLILLDGCRVDALESVSEDYKFLSNPGTHQSPASTSHVWMERTFGYDHRDYTDRTAYVTANPFSAKMLNADEFAILDEVWRDKWDDDHGTVLARDVTKRAISVGRKQRNAYDRLIVHYMQPHFPSIPQPLRDGSDLDTWLDGREMPWHEIRRGTLTEAKVWDAYIANLRYVLDDVQVLLENIDADRAIISADHGNAKGEWGVYSHPDVPLNCLRTVPWYVTEGSDQRSLVPEEETTHESSSISVKERLSALGYRDDVSE